MFSEECGSCLVCVSKVGRTEQVFEAVEEIGTGEKSVGVRVGGVILSAQGVWGGQGGCV